MAQREKTKENSDNYYRRGIKYPLTIYNKTWKHIQCDWLGVDMGEYTSRILKLSVIRRWYIYNVGNPDGITTHANWSKQRKS